MKYFAIKPQGHKQDVSVCTAESIGMVEPELVLGPGDWVVREIGEDEANSFAEEWVKEPHFDDVCPICEGPRSRSPRGEIVMRICRNCGFES